MHTIKLKVGDGIYNHLMFFLKNLKTNELEIIEDKKLIIQKIVKFLIYQNFQINLLKIFGKIKRMKYMINFSKYDIVVVKFPYFLFSS